MNENIELCILLGYCGLHPELMDKLRGFVSIQDLMVIDNILSSVNDEESGETEIVDSIVGRILQLVEHEKSRLGVQTVH